MPFCTECGQARTPTTRGSAPSAARRLVERRRAPAAPEPGRASRPPRSRFGAAGEKADDRRPPSTPRTPPRSTPCPPGSALLVVQRGPERRQPVPARHRRGHRRAPPGQRDLPRRRHGLAPSRRVPPHAATASASATSAASTAPTSTATGSTRSLLSGRRRGADRQVPPGLLRRTGDRRPVSEADARGRRPSPGRRPHEHRRGPRPAAGGLPGHRHPARCASSRPRGWSSPTRTPSGYRKFTDRRRGAAALRPDAAARPLPAAQGHP